MLCFVADDNVLRNEDAKEMPCTTGISWTLELIPSV